MLHALQKTHKKTTLSEFMIKQQISQRGMNTFFSLNQVYFLSPLADVCSGFNQEPM